MKTLNVDLNQRSYPIYIGESLLDEPSCFEPHIISKQVLIVTNETIAPLYLARLEKTLSAFDCHTLILPDGEQYKTLDTANQIFDKLLEDYFDRHCTLVALGGGVIGDITGFAAACYQRGVHFIQVPTTLLAQVDSSVGGKTGVNHAKGKNMIGAFHQPRAVIADTGTLKTLEPRQLSAGIAEVIKYGLIRDLEFLAWLEQNMAKILALEPQALTYAVERSCQNKAEVVAADEFESGQRVLLNLGHTYGHAIETGMGYGVWLHGEAVAAGMCMAARHSQQLGWISPNDVDRVVSLIALAGLPTEKPAMLGVEQMLESMKVDKKVRDGTIRLVLLKAIGEATLSGDYPADSLQKTLDTN